MVGSATRAAELLPDTDKTYEATFQLGLRTDTQDIWGNVQQQMPFAVSAQQLEQACIPLRGDIMQIPPMMSAIRQNGVRLYDLARQGIEVERAARPITIRELTVLDFSTENGTGLLRVQCSKGTYIRTLIADIGEALGCGAVMTGLRRTSACGFTLADAISLDEARVRAENGTLSECVRATESLFFVWPTVKVTENQAVRFQNGGALAAERLRLPAKPTEGTLFRVKHPNNRFLGLGIYHAESDELAIRRLFPEEEK